MRAIVTQRLEQRAKELCTGDRWEQLQSEVLSHSIDPWAAADEMLRGIGA